MYQPALDTGFIRCREGQALHNRHVPRYPAQPRKLQYVQNAVHERRSDGQQRQPQKTPRVGDAAAPHQIDDRKQAAEQDPHQAQVIAEAVGVIGIIEGFIPCGESKHQLVAVVGKHHRKQRNRHGKDGKAVPKQRPRLRTVKKKQRVDRQRGNQQHGYIIAVPQMAQRGGGRGEIKADQTQVQPQQHKRR